MQIVKNTYMTYHGDLYGNHPIHNNNNNMIIVQYLLQFSGPPRPHVQHHFAQVNGGSTNTTKVHALLTLIIYEIGIKKYHVCV